MRDVLHGIIAGIFVCIFWFASHVIAFPRDLDGKYAAENPGLHAWFNSLKSGKGLCCSFADGVSLKDVDWNTDGDGYLVRIDGKWIKVPEAAVITEPNKLGTAVVWPYVDSDGTTQIRCFMPGSGA